MGKRKLGVLMLTVVVIFLPFVSTGQEDDNGLYWWIDEAGVVVPAVQDHFVLGADSWRNEDPFHIIVIGDSIAWGCGLDTSEKYSYLVADCLQKKLEMPVDVTVLAHTGATLEKPTNINKDNHNFLDPELSSWDPTIMEQVDEIRNPEHVDLILVSGGINDVGVDEILNPFTDSYDIFTGCADIEDPMYNILIELLTKCYNAKIIVTSYYPIASNDTPNTATNDFANLIKENDPNWLHRWVGSAFLSRNSIIEKSNTFDSNSRGSIGRAVDRANLYSRSHFNAERVSFALVNFPPERSYGTSTSWLWRLIDTKNGGKTDDHRYDYRTSLCDGAYNLFCNWDDKIAAIGHPNVEGAKEYERAIKSVIESRGLEWLDNTPPIVQLFQVAPTDLAIGEEFTIDYTVSDNGGSGLKQVELWRTQEKDKWPEKPENPIQTNNLAGENGPISGSFRDSPPTPGTYWYGVHVVDNADNWNDERNSNTNYQPGGYVPEKVEVFTESTRDYPSQASFDRTNEYTDETIAGCTPGSVHAACPSLDACVGCDGNCVSSGVDIGGGWVCDHGKWKNTILSCGLKWSNNGHYYKVAKLELNWNDAKIFAENQQFTEPETGVIYRGHLATITSYEENSWVFQNIVLPLNIPTSVWLGGYQGEGFADKPLDGWYWITGERWSWTNWDPSEPNDANGVNEQYLDMWMSSFGSHVGGMWNDEPLTGYHGNTEYSLIEYEQIA